MVRTVSYLDITKTLGHDHLIYVDFSHDNYMIEGLTNLLAISPHIETSKTAQKQIAR